MHGLKSGRAVSKESRDDFVGLGFRRRVVDPIAKGPSVRNEWGEEHGEIVNVCGDDSDDMWMVVGGVKFG